jgi:hypothetical protein
VTTVIREASETRGPGTQHHVGSFDCGLALLHPEKDTLPSAPGIIEMKAHFTGLAVAALLVVAPALANAEDAPASAAPPAAAAPQTEAPPASVPRPSIAPKTAEPAAPAAASEPAPRHRRYAHRHWHRYGYYRTAYWEPFPIFWPHFYHNRVHWSRVPWMFNF